MAKINFYLNQPTAKNRTQIFIHFSFDGKRIKVGTKESVNPKDWNPKTQQVRKSITGNVEINQELSLMRNEVEKIYREMLLEGVTPTRQKMKEAIDRLLGRTNGTSMMELFLAYIEESKSTMAVNSIKKLKGTYNHLIRFSGGSKNKYDFPDIDLRFEAKFRRYLCDAGLNNNSTAKYFKTIKGFLNWATERRYNKNLEYKKFKTKETEGEVVFLTMDELVHLSLCTLSTPHLATIRDAFCALCFTGLRYSDLKALKHDMIKDDMISIYSQKTQQKNTVPLNSYSREIFERYKNSDPIYSIPVVSNQKMNKALKLVGREAGLDDVINLVSFRGSRRDESSRAKHELLTTHVGRKNFITNSIYLGLPTEIIMDITGHKTRKAFKRYFTIVDDIKKSAMQSAWSKDAT
jgi:site-specific recombinase XerD